MRLSAVLCVILCGVASIRGEQCTPKWLRGRYQVVHSRDSIARHINKNANEKALLIHVLDHFKKLEKQLDYESELNGTQCARSGSYSLRSVRQIVRNLGWGSFEGCHRKLEGSDDLLTSRRLFKALGVLRRAAARAGTHLVSSIQGEIWNKSVENGFFEHSDRKVYSRCGIARSLAYRIKGRWRLALDITNENPNKKLPDWKRAYYQETLYLSDSGNVRSYPVNIPKCVDNKRKPGKPGFAFVSIWGGTPKWSAFLTDDIEDNPALKQVLHSLNDNDYVKGQVEESYRLSSIAILVLPSIFVLVPVNLFQFVGNTCTILYIILTDVVSVVPIAIKGIELLTFHQRKHYTTISYVYGNTKSPVMAAETWVSSCQLSDSVRIHGIGLLIFAVCAFFIGMIFETVVHIQVVKDKKVWDNVLHSHFQLNGNGNMSEAERFLHAHFKEHGGGGLFWYFSQVRIMKRIRNRALNTRLERLKRWYCFWVLAEHVDEYLMNSSERWPNARPQSKCFLLRKIQPIIAKRK